MRSLAKRYIWWDERDSMPRRRIVAQVMNLGTFDDITALAGELGINALIDAIQNAQPGWFAPSSWSYWHYRLGLVPPGDPLPPLPRRAFPLK